MLRSVLDRNSALTEAAGLNNVVMGIAGDPQFSVESHVIGLRAANIRKHVRVALVMLKRPDHPWITAFTFSLDRTLLKRLSHSLCRGG